MLAYPSLHFFQENFRLARTALVILERSNRGSMNSEVSFSFSVPLNPFTLSPNSNRRVEVPPLTEIGLMTRLNRSQGLSFSRTVIGDPYCHREGQSPVAISSL